MRARSELRHRLAASALLALLMGAAGAVILTAVAGASRTDSAYGRYRVASHASDFLVSTQISGANDFYQSLGQLPQISSVGIVAGEPLLSFDRSGRPIFVVVNASEDGKAMYSIDAPKLLAGRMPDPSRPYEALANRAMALKYQFHVGSRFPMHRFPTNMAPSVENFRKIRAEKPETFTITGIGVFSDEVVRIAPLDGHPGLLATPAYFRTHPQARALNYDGSLVRLRSGADAARFRRRANQLGRDYHNGRGVGGVFIADQTEHAARVQRAIHPQALALEIFAALAAIGTFLAIGQILAREVHLASVEHLVLRALGFTRGQLIAVAVLRVLAPVTVGALLAVAAAILASPLMPVGAARLAEPDPGISINVAVLGIGFAVMVAISLVVVTSTAWRTATPARLLFVAQAPERTHPSRVAERAARTRLPPSAVSGMRMALEPGRGRTAVPVRSAMAGLVVAIAAVTAAFTFGTNLNRLVSTPRLYGDTWHLDVDAQFGTFSRTEILQTVSRDGKVAGVAGGVYGENVSVDGRLVPTIGIDPIQGSVFPTIVRGHRPAGSDQIVLGAKTMRDLARDIGDRVVLGANGRAHSLRVVGQAVFPAFGRGSFTPTDLGEGAATTARLVAQPYARPGTYNFVLVRYAAGVDPTEETARLTAAVRASGCPPEACSIHARRLPTDVQSYSRVRSTPIVLAGVLGLLAVAMIGHALVTTVRRRRRDLAVLKTLGFVKRQIAATVAWEASTFAVVALVLGIPFGIAAGRWLWTLFADQVGIPSSVVVPLASALVLVPATLVLANAIAAFPGRAAARTQPAVVLRTE